MEDCDRITGFLQTFAIVKYYNKPNTTFWDLEEPVSSSGQAAHYPEPSDKEAFVRNCLYNYHYNEQSVLNTKYSWPQHHHS